MLFQSLTDTPEGELDIVVSEIYKNTEAKDFLFSLILEGFIGDGELREKAEAVKGEYEQQMGEVAGTEGSTAGKESDLPLEEGQAMKVAHAIIKYMGL